MNATRTDFGKAFVDHTTLCKFFQKLEKDDTAYELFSELAGHFIQECNVSTKKQRVDSFFMLGWLAVLSRYGLFKETIRVFLQALRKYCPELYEQIQPELSKNYLKDEFDLTEKDKEKAQKKISEMAQDLHLIKSAFENHSKVKGFKTFKILVTVYDQQCVEKEPPSVGGEQLCPKKKSIEQGNEQQEKNNSANPETYEEEVTVAAGADSDDNNEVQPEIEIRDIPVGDKIISTPHNTDAVYVRKKLRKLLAIKLLLPKPASLRMMYNL